MKMERSLVAALALGLAACGGSESDNVMAPDGNALTPAQVDAALGPEVANEAGNQLDAPGPANTVQEQPPVEQSAPAAPARRAPPPPAPAPAAKADEPEDHSGHVMPAEDAGNEQ